MNRPPTLRFDIDGQPRSFEPEVLIVAGYTGASTDAVQHHIDELAAEGIAPPPRVPMYWAMPPTSLTQDGVLYAPSDRTSGEIELALVVDRAELFVTAASDHTCRETETVDIRLSKLICSTPIATTAWRWDEVAVRWADLELSSVIREHGRETDYQQASAGANRPPADLLAGIPWIGARPQRFVLLCGTVPSIGPIRPAERFDGKVTDPRTGRRLEVAYDVASVPALS